MLRWCNIRSILRCSQVAYSTSNTIALDFKENQEVDIEKPNESQKAKDQESKLVAAAFASLREISANSKKKSAQGFSESIGVATDISSLLAVADQPAIGKYHALKIVSTLSDWAQDGKVKISDFSSDPRFTKLCRILGHPSGKSSEVSTADLSILLGVSTDNQASKLISSIDLPEMVKMLSSLSLRKRRSTPLLRSLSSNISNSSQTLNIKEASDVFYACASLSYPDDALLQKTTEDILLTLNSNLKPAVVNSLVKSIGILRYRDTSLLNALCDWLIEHKVHCGFKEFSSLLFTLANVNYPTENLNHLVNIIQPFLAEKNNLEKIDIVWALLVLDKCDEKLFESVLKPDYIHDQYFKEGNEDLASKLKLLNINAYAKQLGCQYKGPLLDGNMHICNVPLSKMKEKQAIFDLVKETLTSLVTLSDHVRFDVNRKMGFLIDAEFTIDRAYNIVKYDETNSKFFKVAVMIIGYHDMCRGRDQMPTGITTLSHTILRKSGYKVLSIPYYELSIKDKLMTRIQYFSQKLKTLDDIP